MFTLRDPGGGKGLPSSKDTTSCFLGPANPAVVSQATSLFFFFLSCHWIQNKLCWKKKKKKLGNVTHKEGWIH